MHIYLNLYQTKLSLLIANVKFRPSSAEGIQSKRQWIRRWYRERKYLHDGLYSWGLAKAWVQQSLPSNWEPSYSNQAYISNEIRKLG